MSDDNKKLPPGGHFTNIKIGFNDDPKASQIILPVLDGKKMTYDQGIYWLSKMKEEESRVFNWEYKFRGWFPLDAMWAVYRALVEVYGFTHTADFKIQTFFGTLKEPPRMVTVDTSTTTKQQIPWGPLEVSGLSVPLEPHITLDAGLPILLLTAKIRNSEKQVVDRLMSKVEELLRTSSLYRGKAVEVDFTMFSPRDFQFDPERAPKFMDTAISSEEVIFSKDVFDLIDTNVWTLIRNTQAALEHRIPLRRNILLDGKFGVGKTLAARLTARICEENGWTFLYLRDLNQLKQALFFAKKYEPCVIFAEDINRVVSGQRDAEMDALLNVMDGIDRKNDRVMTIFTTNEVETIHAAMLRPGRMDAIITVEPPDAEAAQKLIRLYGRQLVEQDENLSEVGEMLKGQIPAVIREVVERAKLAAIRDCKVGETLKVKADHLRISALQLLKHAARIQPKAPPKPDIVAFGEALGSVIAKGAWLNAVHPSIAPDGHNLGTAAKQVMDKAGRSDDQASS